MSATTTTDCGCGCGGGGGGGVGCVGGGQMLQRPRFFARQLVTPGELNLAGEYVLERMRRHNRLLHGWGVACGAQVCRAPGDDGVALPWKVKIRPGHLIDGHGNEVTIDVDRIVDLRVGVTASASGDPPGEVRDPWCRDVYTEQDGARRVWVAVCHAEQRGRPVRTQPSGCGCDESACEYSRWLDGYEVRLLDACPPSHAGPPPTLDDMAKSLSGSLPDCPECPADPCVVLAVVDLAEDGTITAIDNCSCRRMLITTASLWWRCGGVVRITGLKFKTDGPYTPGMKGITFLVEGENLHADSNIDADLGAGVSITSTDEGDGVMTIVVDLANDAQPGDRTLTLSTHDCSSATWAKALTVSASS